MAKNQARKGASVVSKESKKETLSQLLHWFTTQSDELFEDICEISCQTEWRREDPGAWNQRVIQARDEVRHIASRGFESMLNVLGDGPLDVSAMRQVATANLVKQMRVVEMLQHAKKSIMELGWYIASSGVGVRVPKDFFDGKVGRRMHAKLPYVAPIKDRAGRIMVHSIFA